MIGVTHTCGIQLAFNSLELGANYFWLILLLILDFKEVPNIVFYIQERHWHLSSIRHYKDTTVLTLKLWRCQSSHACPTWRISTESVTYVMEVVSVASVFNDHQRQPNVYLFDKSINLRQGIDVKLSTSRFWNWLMRVLRMQKLIIGDISF